MSDLRSRSGHASWFSEHGGFLGGSGPVGQGRRCYYAWQGLVTLNAMPRTSTPLAPPCLRSLNNTVAGRGEIPTFHTIVLVGGGVLHW
jgi:hypothetical protein